MEQDKTEKDSEKYSEKGIDPEILDLSKTTLEPHVSRALENALALTGGQPVGAADALIGGLLQASSDPSPSAAFGWLRQHFSDFDPTAYSLDSQKSGQPVNLSLLPLAPALAASYATAGQFLDFGGIWGRDYITLILLTRSDPGLEGLVKAQGYTLAQVREDWFRFVTSGRNSDHRRWPDWWRAAGVPVPAETANTGKNARENENAKKVESGEGDDGSSQSISLYQRIKGLAADGIVGPRTRAAMEEDRARLQQAIAEISVPHQFRDSVSWQLTGEGIAIGGSPAEGSAAGTRMVAAIWNDFSGPIDRAARLLYVPVELIVATLCVESGGVVAGAERQSKIMSKNPDSEPVGLMQTTVATARRVLNDKRIDSDWLREPANAIVAGTAVIASQWQDSHYDPPKVASTYAMGRVRPDDNPDNRWRMRQGPGAAGGYTDRFVQAFNDCFRYFAQENIRPPVSFQRLLATPDGSASELSTNGFLREPAPEGLPPEAASDLTAPGHAPDESYLLPGFEADDTSGDDRLDIMKDVRAFAMLLAAKAVKPPLAIGLFGDWGSGKTFFMDKLCQEIGAIAVASQQAGPDTTTAYHAEIVQIKFNAWNYVEANLWASLVTHIFEELNAYFTPRRDEEREQWQRLLKKLNEASLLRRDAEQNLKAAKDELQTAQQEVEAETLNLSGAIDAAWQALGRDKLTKDAIARLEKSLGTESFRALKRSLLTHREEALKLVEGASLIREITMRRLLSPGSAIAFFAVVGAALAMVLAVGAWDLDQQIQSFVTRVGEFVALLGGVSAWAGTALARANGAMKAVESIATSVDQALKNRPEGAALQQAKQRMMVAEDELEQRRQRVADLRSRLDELRPNAQLSKFLSDRAESADYRKYLGLPAMISRDFEQLHRLMDRQTAQTFSVPLSANIRAQLNAGEVPVAIDDALGRIDIPLPGAESRAEADMPENADAGSGRPASQQHADSEATAGTVPALRVVAKGPVAGESGWTIFDDDNGRSIDIVPGADGTAAAGQLQCTIQWRLPRIDRIVLYIDDLDRCPPSRVVEVLQAVHLLLSFPLFVVVVGVDARWVSRALLRHYRGQWRELSAEMEMPGHGATPHDYLEKIFQIPFWLRPMPESATCELLNALAPVAPVTTHRPPPALETEGANGRELDTVISPQAESPQKAESPQPIESPQLAESPQRTGSTQQAESQLTEEQEPVTGVLPAEDIPEPVNPSADIGVEAGPGEAVEAEEAGKQLLVDLNPGQLLFTSGELEHMQHLAPLLGRSPRSVKRFVNVYRLYRARVRLAGDEDFNRLLGSESEPGSYRIVLFLLALITGHPEIAQVLLRAIAETSSQQTLGNFIEAFLEDGLAGSDAARRSGNRTTTEQWQRIFKFLDQPSRAMSLDWIQEIAAQIRRYSFRVGRL